jgi:hypothetical protein
MCDFRDELRLDQRLVALHVHDGLAFRQVQQPRGFGEPVGARGVLGSRHQRLVAVLSHGAGDALVVGRHVHGTCAALRRPLAYVHHHRLAVELGKGFAGKSGGCVARGDEDVKRHATSSSGGSLRASSSSITGMPSFTG